MDAIVIEHLSKQFDNGVKAVDDLSITIPQGKIFGFFGPNGSGKTTTIRLLNTVLIPTNGTAVILGKDISTNSGFIHHHCGIITESAAAYEHLNGYDNLNFFGKMYEVANVKKRVNELLK